MEFLDHVLAELGVVAGRFRMNRVSCRVVATDIPKEDDVDDIIDCDLSMVLLLLLS